MGDLSSRKVSTTFLGLVTSTAILCGVGGVALVTFETARQIRRLPRTRFHPFWKRTRRDRDGPTGVLDRVGVGVRGRLTCEDWEMGHLYTAREFHAATPTPNMSRWPILWAWQVLRFDDWFYATHTGMDTVVYVRFLRAMTLWMLLHTITTAPILLAVHFRFSDPRLPDSDMSRASLSSLVTQVDPSCTKTNLDECDAIANNQGRRLLWIHLCLLWYITITWIGALIWLGKGSLRIRRRLIDHFREQRGSGDVHADGQPDKTAAAASARAEKPSAAVDGEADQAAAAPDPLPNGASAAMAHVHGLTDKHLRVDEDADGWRQRTLMVVNLPPSMRDEASVRRYFEEFLRPDDEASDDGHDGEEGDDPEEGSAGSHGSGSGGDTNARDHKMLTDAEKEAQEAKLDRAREKRLAAQPKGPAPDTLPERHHRSPVQAVVLVRKMNELSGMLARRQQVLEQLEAAHIKLAKNVLEAVGKRTSKMRRDEAKRGQGWGLGKASLGTLRRTGSRLWARTRRFGSGSDDSGRSTAELNKSAAQPAGALDAEGAGVTSAPAPGGLNTLTTEQLRLDDLALRLARFSPSNRGRHVRESQNKGQRGEDEANELVETVWEALATVPRELLDPYQPVTRLSALFRGRTVPTIDYLLTKLNLLTALITEMRARPPATYEPASTAFVTFRDPRQARMVWRELKGQIVVRVQLAPEVKDLDWDRLMRTSFTGDILRGLAVNVFFWALTIFWVIPIVALFSVESLQIVVPGLSAVLQSNQRLAGFVSSTLPTLLVSLVTMSVPEIIFQISKRFQGHVTFSSLYDACLCRFWKFAICNVVIFFCIGATTVRSILTSIGADQTKALDSIAKAFPAAGPFYVSWFILGMGLHTGFELMGFMIPLLQHYGARKAVTPRARATKTLPRNFNRYYWLPYHVLVMTIVFIFALLQPLVIPFAFLYVLVAMVVFKKNLAFTYFRRFNEMEGVLYYKRILRFSLDGLIVAQVVLLIFFSVTKQAAVYLALTAVLIPITTTVKLLATRLWMSQCRALADDEANAVCGIGSGQSLTSSGRRDYDTVTKEGSMEAYDVQSPLDARASGRYPAAIPPPTTGPTMLRIWQRIHYSFTANGADRPSMVVETTSRRHALAAGARSAASAPFHSVKHRAGGFLEARAAMREQTELKHQLKEDATEERELEVERAQQRERSIALRVEQGREIQRSLAAQAEGERRRVPSSTSRRVASGSEGAPFLSGFEAVAFHAPVPSEDSAITYVVDEDEVYKGPEGTLHRARSARRFGSYSTSIVKHGGPGRLSILDTPHEKEEFGKLDQSRLGGGAATSDSEGTTSHARKGTGGDEKTQALEKEEEEQRHLDAMEAVDEAELQARYEGALVRPHAKVAWDDTPNNRMRYDNPFYSCTLDPFLWLPRDPMAPLDLCDTIEWHGLAFVSSQGGKGRLGEWDEEAHLAGTTAVDDADGGAGDAETGVDALAAICGDEEIVMNSTLANRLHEVEDAEVAADPAESLPRGVMDEYRKAIRRDTDGAEGGEEQDAANAAGAQQDDERGGWEAMHALRREGSIRSLLAPRPMTLRSLSWDGMKRRRSSQGSGVVGGGGAERRPSASQRRDSAKTVPEGVGAAATAEEMASGNGPPLASPHLLPEAQFTDAPTGLEEAAGAATMSGVAGAVTAGAPSATAATTTTTMPRPGIHFDALPASGRSPHTPRTTHSRRGGAVAGVGAAAPPLSRVDSMASAMSGRSAGSRSVSMAQALRAEVLEEERRRTIRERVQARRALTKSSKRSARIDAEDEEAQRATFRDSQRSRTLIDRHQQAIDRRRGASISESGNSTAAKRMSRSGTQATSLGFAMSQSPNRTGQGQTMVSTSTSGTTRHEPRQGAAAAGGGGGVSPSTSAQAFELRQFGA